ncbi:MAG: DedA family protein [Candidatus Pacebacteria bacterium]|jgi:membrane protein YqaA with SNARE-associated domain|nr:DedA family protein [Candidatus Paceibacterota bacterium]
MKEFLNKRKEALFRWSERHVQGPHGKWWLAGISFAESSFFPIPPDLFLIGMLMGKDRSRWARYALITTIASVAGGLFGYLIGYLFFSLIGAKIVALYGLESAVAHVRTLYADNAFFAILVAGFTPIPYKVFTIAAGLFHIHLPIFIIASLLGRGGRFFIVSFLMRRYGGKLGELVYRYFNLFSLIVVALIVLGFYFLV